MAQSGALTSVLQQLQEFKKKFYLNLLIKGGLISAGLLLSFFLIFNLLEYFLYLPKMVRAVLFFSFLALCIYSFWRWIVAPLSALANLKRLLSDEQAAQRVGEYYPEIKDKLLNAIQLKDLDRTNELIAASIEQKAKQLSSFNFKDSVKIEENKPLLKYVMVPLLLVIGILLVYPSIFVQGTERIIHYGKFYAPEAPFKFVVKNEGLQAFRNEDFNLEVSVEGKSVPNEISILYNGREQKLTREKGSTFTFGFKRLQKPVDFRLSGSGFVSDEYTLEVLSRPNLKDFFVEIQYPAYLKKKPETIRNTGNLTVPQGSQLLWKFTTADTEKLELKFDKPAEIVTTSVDNAVFTARKKIMEDQAYSVELQNKYSKNKEAINYLINTIPDRFPEISIENFRDTTSYDFLVLGGSISDDYGLTRLSLHYRVVNTSAGSPKSEAYKAIPLKIDPQQLSQTYFHQWNLSNLQLNPGDRLEYFVQVWDNDGIRGNKSSRTRTFDFHVPSKQDLEREIASNSKSVENQLSKSLERSSKLQQELNKTEEKMKSKRDLSWQDRKQLEEMVEKKKQLEQDIQSLKEMFDQLNQKQNRVDERDQQLAEKAQQLQELMKDLLDEETKKLYEELEKLLQQQRPNDTELQKLLSKLDRKETNLEKELERALELFKQLQFEQKLDNAVKKLDELAKREEKLSEQTSDKDKKSGEEKKAENEQLKQEQSEIKKEFDQLKQELKEMKDLDKQLNNQNNMEDTSGDEQSIEQDMNESQQSLQKQQNNKASKAQKNAADKMKKLSEKMNSMKMEMNMAQAQENLDGLRDILENLIKLSFDQEDLMKQFRGVNQSDPRFVALSQQQLKLKDDARIIEDSLQSLAKKVFQIRSFVTREVGIMNEHMNESMKYIKDRNIGRATGHQQLSMTSMNNLALMLNDALKQMQQQMAQQMKGQQQCSKPSGKPKPGNMGQMQQSLNQKIEELKKGGKTGKALSEELAKLASEQEKLRNALKELEKQMSKDGKKPGEGQLGNIGKMMEQTETDLVNKRLTEQTILRQREILTRLLEAEKAAKERELDDKREAKTAEEKQRPLPPSFEKYIKTKEKQTELLKTVSPALSPYYKQEVSEYFQRIGQ